MPMTSIVSEIVHSVWMYARKLPTVKRPLSKWEAIEAANESLILHEVSQTIRSLRRGINKPRCDLAMANPSSMC